MKTLLVLAAVLLTAAPAAPRQVNRRRHSAYSTRARPHQWRKHRRSYPRGIDGSRREGPLRVGPDGTTVPEGLHPRIQPRPEIVKPPRRGS